VYSAFLDKILVLNLTKLGRWVLLYKKHNALLTLKTANDISSIQHCLHVITAKQLCTPSQWCPLNYTLYVVTLFLLLQCKRLPMQSFHCTLK